MLIHYDNLAYATRIWPSLAPDGGSFDKRPADLAEIRPLISTLFGAAFVGCAEIEEPGPLWRYAFLAGYADRSQYDILVDLCRESITLPHGCICLAGEGTGFHGFRNRPWAALAGNIHLSAYLAPGRPVENFGTGFTILAAVSVIDAIDALSGLHGRAGIKWVNDILIDGSKICGVLAHTQAEGETVTGVVLGIGLNVMTAPVVEPTPYVPKVASLRDFAGDSARCSEAHVLAVLLRKLEENYQTYLVSGYHALLDRYRERSLVLGREVEIRSDDPGGREHVVAGGRVLRLGDNLELVLVGHDDFVTKGRLILKNPLGP